ncbi:flagellar hook-length control protein FliK [Sphingomonas sp. LY54]|uniref:flagellar hook-length control protein FliK n=1 Tax=Sphingomonas sp. LY54 TaxID=3095343 RepID=UPI002D778630|nr:flagellar hook-length control protein FliK [Sphingomonas sp. LY54]WRP30088.1 flagellar hook-length control protein FliK [Sphingomonas sp. LY54]
MNIASITFATPSAAPDAAAGAALLGAFGQVLDATLQPAAASAFIPATASGKAVATTPVAATDGQAVMLATGPEIPIAAAVEAAPADDMPALSPDAVVPQPNLKIQAANDGMKPDPIAPPQPGDASKPIESKAANAAPSDPMSSIVASPLPTIEQQAAVVAAAVVPAETAEIEPAVQPQAEPGTDAPAEAPAAVLTAAPAPTPHALSTRNSPTNAPNAPVTTGVKSAASAPTSSTPSDAAPATSADNGSTFAASVSAAVDGGDHAVTKADGLPSSLLSQSLPAQAARPAAAHPYPAQAQAPAVVNARPGQIGHEMGVEIARRVSAGRDEVTIRLNPIEMGRIEVRMAFDDAGSLRAVVAAESPAALDMLRRDAADLTRALTDAGIRSDAQSLRFDSRSGGDAQGWQRQQNGGEQRSGDGRSAAADTPEGDEPQYRPLRSSGQIDLMA